MPKILKTRAAARELGLSYSQLIYLLHSDKIVPPAKDSSGDYVWLDADLDRVRERLGKPLKLQEALA